MKVIELKEVQKKFHHTLVLQDVSLSVEEGDILGVIGQSGSGKTTLLNLMAGFTEPTEGEVLFYTPAHQQGIDLNKNLHKLKGKLGYTPQHNSLYPKLTVEENLWHFGLLSGKERKMLKINVQNLLNFTHLIEHRKKLAEELSGGMQKRLDISCSLVHKPQVLILDEPTADLDPILQKEILHMLQEINKQGVTIIIASHHLDSIEHLCNKVIIVHNGKVHSHGLLEDVRRPYLRDHFTITLKPGQRKNEIIARIRSFPIRKIVDKGNSLIIYPENVQETTKHILNLIKEESLYLHDIDLRQPSLHEVFENIVLGDR